MGAWAAVTRDSEVICKEGRTLLHEDEYTTCSIAIKLHAIRGNYIPLGFTWRVLIAANSSIRLSKSILLSKSDNTNYCQSN